MEATVWKLGLVLGLASAPLAAWASPKLAIWLRARQHIRPEGPTTHGKKAGTPTMGGLVPLGLVFLSAGIIWAVDGMSRPDFFPLAAMGLGSLVGLVDDLCSQRGRRSTGFFPHQTIFAQLVAAFILVLITLPHPYTVRLPFSELAVSLPAWGWVPLLILAFLGTVNGVNLADGLDGLATGLFLISLLGLLPLSLAFPRLSALSLVALGAGLGFLWANAYPAAVFLGNVGSMGLGGFLFGLAWSTGGVLFLPLTGGVFVLEAISDILQVGSFKLTGTRLFKMSPFHHHLEDVPVPWPHRLKSPNWPEPKVVIRLWVLGAACALLCVLASL
ncbi:MAG: phospho-N-acetylmuramoyl-pentapeptide-transferase [Candidatus Bipolaricaulota bacterium]|nr:phospho-N-acetylmuramoyl-pentapeptide-transferase [Candidatus Bipolaricaulota bacterium]MDW8126979.1 phospho-N-acetylmuramoyl-pentapeptide-transferase [Candidatus Bipolaricaulota bacterium]